MGYSLIVDEKEYKLAYIHFWLEENVFDIMGDIKHAYRPDLSYIKEKLVNSLPDDYILCGENDKYDDLLHMFKLYKESPVLFWLDTQDDVILFRDKLKQLKK